MSNGSDISTPRTPALWFTATGAGPDLLSLELQPMPSDLDGEIPASLGVRIRAEPGPVIFADDLVDGGFHLNREQVAQLHQQLGAWLATSPTPAATTSKPNIVLCGVAAVESGRPLFVQSFHGWVPGNEQTRARAERMIASGHGDGTWIYGVEAAPAETAVVKLGELEAARAAMTPGEWWVADSDGHICSGPDGRECQYVGGFDVATRDAVGIVVTHNAAGPLVGLARAVLEHEAAMSAAAKSRYAYYNNESEEDYAGLVRDEEALARCEEAYAAARARVTL